MQWRIARVCPLAFWLHYLSGIGSPLATKAAWEAAGDHSRFLLAVLIGESKAGTHFNRNRPENKNALNLRPPLRPDGTREPGDYMRFERWEDGIRAARERITSPTYGGGIYAETVTVLEFAHVWAPATDDNDPEAFAAAIEERIDSYPREEEQPMADLVFGRVTHPPFVDKMVWANTAWNDLGPRNIVGCVRHTMVGSLAGSYGWINGGGGSASALWDYSVGGSTDGVNDGAIWRHNDPRGRRAGWANGGSDGLEGDGPLFVRTLGIAAINRDLVSIERSDGGNINTPMSPKQIESIAQIEAYWFDQADVPWNVYPFNPHTQCVTDLFHLEFAIKGCPHGPVVNEINRQQDRTRAIMKAAQEGGTDDTTPPPAPVKPDHGKYPPGVDKALAADWFGVGILYRENGKKGKFAFHEGRAVCEAWLARGDKESTYPPVVGRWQFRDSPETLREIVRWENGWTLVKLNEAEGWKWA